MCDLGSYPLTLAVHFQNPYPSSPRPSSLFYFEKLFGTLSTNFVRFRAKVRVPTRNEEGDDPMASRQRMQTLHAYLSR